MLREDVRYGRDTTFDVSWTFVGQTIAALWVFLAQGSDPFP